MPGRKNEAYEHNSDSLTSVGFFDPEYASCIGQTLEKIVTQKGFPTDIDFACVYKESIGSFIIPSDPTQLDANDRVCLCGSRSDIMKAVKFPRR